MLLPAEAFKMKPTGGMVRFAVFKPTKEKMTPMLDTNGADDCGIHLWLDAKGGFPQEVIGRMSMGDERRMIFTREEQIGPNQFSHTQLIEKGNDSSISISDLQSDYQQDLYVMELSPTLRLVVRVSRLLGMNAKVRERRERDARDPGKNPARGNSASAKPTLHEPSTTA